KVLWTVTGAPPNGGTWVPRKRAATQPPTGVPAKGGPSTLAVVAWPLLAKVTAMRPEPVGPSDFLQLCAAVAAALSAESAAGRSKSPAPPAGGAGAGACSFGAGTAGGTFSSCGPGGGALSALSPLSPLFPLSTLAMTVFFSPSGFGAAWPGARAVGAADVVS